MQKTISLVMLRSSATANINTGGATPLCIIRLWLENPMTLVMGSVDLKENLKKVISMSILIKGMEMPKDGVYWCEIGVAGEIATITIHGEDRKSFGTGCLLTTKSITTSWVVQAE